MPRNSRLEQSRLKRLYPEFLLPRRIRCRLGGCPRFARPWRHQLLGRDRARILPPPHERGYLICLLQAVQPAPQLGLVAMFLRTELPIASPAAQRLAAELAGFYTHARA